MTIQQFFDAYNGFWVETNKGEASTNDQCVDLWRAYNLKVVGGPNVFGNAYEYWENYPTDFYDRILNTIDAIPKLGDVIIWQQSYGGYGHIAICTDIANQTSFTSFDQNDPTGQPCHYQPHNYTKVLGWLRPKNLPTSEEEADEKKALDILKSIPRDNSLEGLANQLAGEHINYSSVESKAKQLDGFIAKWVEEYKLSENSNLVEIENEMAKLLLLEDTANKFRDAIEGVVGGFDNDSALLGALQSLRADKDKLSGDLAECQLKLSNKKVLYAFNMNGFTIKVYKREVK